MSDFNPFFNPPPSNSFPTSDYSSFMTQTTPSSSLSPSSLHSSSVASLAAVQSEKGSESTHVEERGGEQQTSAVTEVRQLDDNDGPATVDLQIESELFLANDDRQPPLPRCTVSLSGKAFFFDNSNSAGQDRALKTHRDQFANCCTVQDKVDSVGSPKMLLASDRKDILKVTFNQEFSMFTCATENGLLLYNLDPLLLKSKLGLYFFLNCKFPGFFLKTRFLNKTFFCVRIYWRRKHWSIWNAASIKLDRTCCWRTEAQIRRQHGLVFRFSNHFGSIL